MSSPAPGRQTGSFGDELTNAAMIGLIGVFALALLLRAAGSVAAFLTGTAQPGAGPAAGVGVLFNPGDPATALDAEARRAESVVKERGQWVARLASKYVGIVDPAQTTASGSHTFAAADIYAEHALLARAIDADVYLLDSRKWTTRRVHEGEPYWMTVAVSDAFVDADAVLAWCSRQYPTLSGTALSNRCLPMQLTAG